MAFLVLTTTQHLLLFLFFLFSRWTLHKFCELYMPFPNIGNPDRDVNTSMLEKGKSLQKIRIRIEMQCVIHYDGLISSAKRNLGCKWIIHTFLGNCFCWDWSPSLHRRLSLVVGCQNIWSSLCSFNHDSRMRPTNFDQLIPAMSKELI